MYNYLRNIFLARRVNKISSYLPPVRTKGSHHGQQLGRFKPIKKDETDINKIRNIGIMAHIDAGKTTTTERFLYYAGFTKHLGSIDAGDTVTDFMDQERERGITITSAAISFFWNNHRINLIDTPGHIDFTLEVERSLRVLDGAVAVLDAAKGVEAQTLTVWRQADQYNIPRIIYLNKMDKAQADFHNCLNSIQEKLQISPLVTQLPIGENHNFSGVIDLVSMRTLVWDSSDENGASYSALPITSSKDPSLFEEAYEARVTLIDRLADLDETLAEKVLSDIGYENINSLDVTRAIRKATIINTHVPLLCGSSFRNKGVQPLLNSIVNYLPHPGERTNSFVEYYKNKLCGLAFKTVHNKFYGPVTFIRLYSGTLDAGSTIYNVNRECKQTVGRLFQVYADEYQVIQQGSAGNIIAATGLNETVTGDTLVLSAAEARSAALEWLKSEEASQQSTGASKQTAQQQSHLVVQDEDEEEGHFGVPVLAGVKIPEPVFLCSIEAHTLSQQKALEEALTNLTREDPSLRVGINPDTKQTILSGMGELHLEVICERIRREYGADVSMGPLVISYRETLETPVQGSAAIDRVIGRQRHRVTMTLSLVPGEEDELTNQKLADVVPSEESSLITRPVNFRNLRAVTQGAKTALNRGPLLRFPVINARLQLNDFMVHSGTSRAMISACASECVTQALRKACTRLLQPMMLVEVNTDETYSGVVLHELSRRDGQIEGIDSPSSGQNSNLRTVRALMPLAAVGDLCSTLRRVTSGTAGYSIELSRYAAMSREETDAAVERVTGFKPRHAEAEEHEEMDGEGMDIDSDYDSDFDSNGKGRAKH